MQPDTITQEQFQQLVDSGKTIEQDSNGPKVVLLPHNNWLKIFYPRGNSQLKQRVKALPQQRFIDNVTELQQRDIITLKPTAYLALEKSNVEMVCYEPVPGESIRNLLRQGPIDPSLTTQLANYIAKLHDKGIYFRSLHLGNVILMPSGELALIDIADMTFQKRPLSLWQRLRNLKHLLKFGETHAFREALLQDYARAANLGSFSRRAVIHHGMRIKEARFS